MCNGATHSRASKHEIADESLSLLLMLQWSHALTRVETRSALNVFVQLSLPLQLSHALTRVETQTPFSSETIQ